MRDKGLYIVQIFGILLLLCGYLISNQPDSLSLMHFNPNPDYPTVISKTVKGQASAPAAQASVSSHNNPSRKSESPKFISFELLVPARYVFTDHPVNCVKYTIPLPETYEYLFFEEINPPPPKAC
jgi:hypothetical protein